MKHKSILVVIAAAALMLCACGQVEDNSLAETEAPAAAESTAVEAAEDSSEAEETEEAVPEAPEEPQETEEDSEAETEVTENEPEEPEAITYEGTFDSVQGESYTAQELMDKGLGNILSDGTGYVLVPDSGGAGHAYYKLFYTANGTDWTEGQVYDELNGKNIHVQLDKGDLLLISSGGAASSDFPAAYHLTFNGDSIESEPIDDFFDPVKNALPEDQGPVLLDSFENTGYKYHAVFTDAESGEVVFETDMTVSF